MSSRFNMLYQGEPASVILELKDRDASNDELRAALINAFRRIDALTDEVRELREQIGRA